MNYPEPYVFFLLRHGESIGNAENRYQGLKDYPLTELGKAQARALAQHWLAEGVVFERILSSPLLRARQTAEIIAHTLHQLVQIDPIWSERDVGTLAGLTPEETHQRLPGPLPSHPYYPVGETGESQWKLFLHAGQAVETLVELPPGRYLVASHGAILNMVMYAVLGLTPYGNFKGPRFRFGNAAYATLTYEPSEHAWRVYSINDQRHLDGLHTYSRPASASEKEAGPLEIRPARQEDMDGIVTVWCEAEELHGSALPGIFRQPENNHEREYLTGLLANLESVLLVAVDSATNEIAGVLHANLKTSASLAILQPRRYAVINNLVVKQAFHRSGIGQRLMEAAETWAAGLGASEVELNVWEFNQGAITFYSRIGYTTASRKMWKKL